MWLYALFWSVMPLCGWSGFELEGVGTSCFFKVEVTRQTGFVVPHLLDASMLRVASEYYNRLLL